MNCRHTKSAPASGVMRTMRSPGPAVRLSWQRLTSQHPRCPFAINHPGEGLRIRRYLRSAFRHKGQLSRIQPGVIMIWHRQGLQFGGLERPIPFWRGLGKTGVSSIWRGVKNRGLANIPYLLIFENTQTASRGYVLSTEQALCEPCGIGFVCLWPRTSPLQGEVVVPTGFHTLRAK